KLPRLFNATVRVKEWQGEVVFLHEVVAGAADPSYGIQGAKLARPPPSGIERAQLVLAQLEAEDPTSPARRPVRAPPPVPPPPRPRGAGPARRSRARRARRGARRAQSRRNVAARGARGALCAQAQGGEGWGLGYKQRKPCRACNRLAGSPFRVLRLNGLHREQ